MRLSIYIIPILFIVLFVYAQLKKVKLYDAFADGAKGAFPLALSIFPYLAAIFVITELFEVSGFSDALSRLLAPAFKLLGIPAELSKLVLVKPFSGSGALALVSDIYQKYGADSYIARCASCIYGSSETVFYIAAVYFAGAKQKKLFLPIVISLFSGILACSAACLLCLIM